MGEEIDLSFILSSTQLAQKGIRGPQPALLLTQDFYSIPTNRNTFTLYNLNTDFSRTQFMFYSYLYRAQYCPIVGAHKMSEAS